MTNQQPPGPDNLRRIAQEIRALPEQVQRGERPHLDAGTLCGKLANRAIAAGVGLDDPALIAEVEMVGRGEAEHQINCRPGARKGNKFSPSPDCHRFILLASRLIQRETGEKLGPFNENADRYIRDGCRLIASWIEASASVARPTEADAAADEGENKGDKVVAKASGRLNVSELAELYDLDDFQADALRGRLGRWRPSHCNGEWIEVPRSYRRPNTAKYLYDPDAIRPIIDAMKARAVKTSSERPSVGNQGA